MRVAQLKLEAEKGAVHERAENVGGEIWPGKRPLCDVDQIECVEIADKGEDRDDADGWQDQRQLYLPERRHSGYAVDLARFQNFIGDGKKGCVDKHHRDADELPDRDQRQRCQRVLLLPQPWRKQELEAHCIEHRRRDAPNGRKDEFPREADDHERQDRGDEDRGAIKRRKAKAWM